MTQYYAKSTGTRVSGASTLNDWSDANCYPTPNAAVNTAWTSADEVVLNDEEWTLTLLQTGVSAAATGNTLNLRSKSNDPALCSVTSTHASGTALTLNHATKIYHINCTGIKWIKSGTYTGASPTLVQCSGLHGNASFTNCIFGPATLVDGSATSRAQAHFGVNAASRTVTFTGCTFTTLSSTLLGGNLFGYFNAGNKVIFDNCDFNGLIAAVTANNNAYGGFLCEDILDIRNSRVNGLTMTHAGTTDDRLFEPLFVTSETGTMLVDGLTDTGVAMTGGIAGAWLLNTYGPFDVKNLYSTNSYSRPLNQLNNHGGVFLATGELAQGVGSNFRAYNSRATFGTLVYCSQGAGGVFTEMYARDCEAYSEGILYSGGWGDVTFDQFELVGSICGTDPHLGDAGYGGAIYGHIHTNATRDKTTIISNGLIVGTQQRQDGEGGIRMRGQCAGRKHTVSVTNVDIDSPGHLLQITPLESAGCYLDISLSNVACHGGQLSVDTSRITGGGVKNLTVSNIASKQVTRGASAGNGVVRYTA